MYYWLMNDIPFLDRRNFKNVFVLLSTEESARFGFLDAFKYLLGWRCTNKNST